MNGKRARAIRKEARQQTTTQEGFRKLYRQLKKRYNRGR